MSAQGALSEDENNFGLIETLLWTRQAGYWLADGHAARLARSAAELGFVYSRQNFDEALARACAEAKAPALRVRLELRRDGVFLTQAVPFPPQDRAKIWRVAIAERRIDSRDPLLRHKTTRRALYEDALARAQGADEVVFLNERNEVCEGARTNVFFVEDSGRLLTPPLDCGLLPGVLRAHLLDQGRAREKILHRENLRDGFFLGNSLRGLVRVRLVD